jgi:predicted aldo/keto reductase-like oxidoreductase
MGKKNLTRRQFVTTSLMAGAGTMLLGKTGLSFPNNSTVRSSDPLQIITLGNSGLKSTLIGMGTGFSAYNRSSSIIRAGVAESMIRSAYEKGIRFFDCADSYGTHPYVSSALKGIPRDNYLISTKMWLDRGGIPEPERPDANIVLDRFRKELNTDYIDLVQIHCQTDGKWPDKHKKQMDILENLKAKKIIRAHGVSIHSMEAMGACVESPWPDVVHVRVNPYGESMDNADPQVVIPLIEKLHKSGKGIIGMKLIGNGKFRNDSDKITASLKYVLGLGTVDLLIVGFELPEQIDNYIGRVEKELKMRI